MISATKRIYLQIERNALAIILGITKYEKYLMGKHFIVYTDNKPFVRLFNPKQATSNTAADRI